jgi:hypothetical protein
MNRDLVEAIRALVDATLVVQCTPVLAEGHLHEEHCVVCALDLLKKICVEPEFSGLRSWAEQRLRDHADDDNETMDTWPDGMTGKRSQEK